MAAMKLSCGDNQALSYDDTSWGVRHIQAVLMFFLFVVGLGSRFQLSVAIVAMTDNSTSPNPDVPTYNWTNKSVLLSSFYWGYLTLQIFAGALSSRMSTRIYLSAMATLNSITCFLVPFMASQLGSTGVMVCRILQGVSQGAFYPSVYLLLGRWAPLRERARLSAIAMAGAGFATIFTLPLVGYMSSTWWGWPSTYYLFGGLNLAWTGLFLMLGADSPRKHPTISEAERNYIESSLNKGGEVEEHLIPIKPVLTSIPFWALTLNSVAMLWGSLTMANEIPNYMSKVMKYDINSDGLLASLPSLVGVFASIIFAALADYVINREYLSRTWTRKIFTAFGNVGWSISILVLAFLPADSNVLSITMLVLSHALGSATSGGSSVNQIDLSPKYSGFIMSICNTLGVSIGLTGPLMVQAVVVDETVKSQWTIIFVVSSVLCLIFTVVYVIFASGDIQWWNFYGTDVKTREDFEKLQEKVDEMPQKKETDFI